MGMLLRTFSSRKQPFLLKLFETYIRPIVEYAAPAWTLLVTGLVERVQGRFTKRMHELDQQPYTRRLELLRQLDSLAAIRKFKTRGKEANLVVRRPINNLVNKIFWLHNCNCV
jgi:hypothetical protein